MVKRLLLALGVATSGCADAEVETPPAPTLEVAWRLSGLANPESVALSRDGDFLYVTNVDGAADGRDGQGFIARVSLDGRMLQRDFATGLNAPKGVALYGSNLYVADIDAVVVVSADNGATLQRIPAPDADFLNDVAVTEAGLVLVADSGRSRIYAVHNGAAAVWVEDALLESVNGLTPEADRLLVTTMAGRLLTIDYQTRAISTLAEGLGDADGLAPVGDGRYFVSEWPGLMHVVDPATGAHKTILDSRAEERYVNDFLRVGDRLYTPHWEPSELTAYRIGSVAP